MAPLFVAKLDPKGPFSELLERNVNRNPRSRRECVLKHTATQTGTQLVLEHKPRFLCKISSIVLHGESAWPSVPSTKMKCRFDVGFVGDCGSMSFVGDCGSMSCLQVC